MKIIFIVNSMGKGGAERVITNLSSYLAQEHKVSIISIHNTKVEYKLNKKVDFYTLDEEIFDLYDEKGKQRLNAIQKIKRLISRIRKMNKYKKGIEPDIIIAFMQKASFIVLLSNIFNKKTSTIVSVRNDPNVEFSTKKDKILMKWLYPKADGYVFQTEEAREYFNKKIRQKSEVIPNPINPYFIEKSYEGERCKEIVSIGRLTYRKKSRKSYKSIRNVA